MAWLSGSLSYVLPFLIVLTVLVFVHELGHYLSARRNGVRVEVFSIGFGPELFGRTDRAGTRWRVSLIPLGGYIKMFGDMDMSSVRTETPVDMTEEEKAVSFHHKRLIQRTEIVAAGPIANFAFAIVVLAIFFMTAGQPFTPPDIGQVQPGSAAERAGLQPGDVITSVDGKPVERFEDIQQVVSANQGTPIDLTVRREGKELTVKVTPVVTDFTDIFGSMHHIGRIGVVHIGESRYVKRGPVEAVGQAIAETWNMSTSTLTAVGQMIIGTRTTDELGGPLRIAQMSGIVAQSKPSNLIWFMAVLSVNLGLINLFPIPVLDGGHLLFYSAEAIRGRPLGQRAQEYGFGLGLALVLILMVFATWNDFVHLGIIARLKGWIT
ncbi:MAG TPA: RIP metalloprotease RseP [Stellaceae bacterium]|nr:RIP metalloprotease RseP [Stellaceae bacterium]